MNSFIEFDLLPGNPYCYSQYVPLALARKAAQAKLMYLKCAHPDCSSDFDYAQGRLYRFQQTPQQDQQPTHWHAVKHYWLCGRCCENYAIDYQKGVGVLILERIESLPREHQQPGYYVLQAEVAPKPVVPRRVAISRSRRRKPKMELMPATVSAVEVLENRNVERRG